MIRPFSFADILFIAEAIRWTIALSAIAFAGGAIGGLLIALAGTADIRWLRNAAMLFIRLFQGTPLSGEPSVVSIDIGAPVEAIVAAAAAQLPAASQG